MAGEADPSLIALGADWVKWGVMTALTFVLGFFGWYSRRQVNRIDRHDDELRKLRERKADADKVEELARVMRDEMASVRQHVDGSARETHARVDRVLEVLSDRGPRRE